MAEYDERVNAIISEDKFKLLTSLTHFNGLHWEDKREVLTGLSDVTDSDVTGYEALEAILDGKHKDVVCKKCHESSEISYTEFDTKKKKLMPKFKLLKSRGDCIDCHKEEHKERFKGVGEGREITCGACHSVENEWKDYGYKHKSEIKFKKYQLNYKAEESECEKCHTCGTEVFCVSCCVRRCMPCEFRQKILRSKDIDLYQLKNREP